MISLKPTGELSCEVTIKTDNILELGFIDALAYNSGATIIDDKETRNCIPCHHFKVSNNVISDDFKRLLSEV